eukprot:3921815-Pleurochrysis_carterae.AAC.3
MLPAKAEPSTSRSRVNSAAMATPVRAMLATSARRNAARYSRHLRNGQRSIGFVVDSGCTWHIHPYLSDLVHVCACDIASRALTVDPSVVSPLGTSHSLP